MICIFFGGFHAIFSAAIPINFTPHSFMPPPSKLILCPFDEENFEGEFCKILSVINFHFVPEHRHNEKLFRKMRLSYAFYVNVNIFSPSISLSVKMHFICLDEGERNLCNSMFVIDEGTNRDDDDESWNYLMFLCTERSHFNFLSHSREKCLVNVKEK